MDRDEAARAFREFVDIIRALRTPGTGCPWDLEQDHRTLRPYLLEETNEVVEAIDGGDDAALQEELGDLLLQVVLHAQVAADRGAFSITEVVRGIAEKMVRRHPHVFGSVVAKTSEDVKRNWEQIKTAEKARKNDRKPSMAKTQEYVLGHSARAARRLEIQDAHLGAPSERFLDLLALRPGDRVVELGCGPGGLSRRILRRLGAGGVLVSVDSSEGLLKQAKELLAGEGPARFEPVQADVTQLGDWLNGADVVLGRSVLHHVPMAELVVGRLRARVRPGTRVGFLEPDFRASLGRLGYLEQTGRTDVVPLRVWATVINQLYLANRISPDVGASLARTLGTAGYQEVRAEWSECRSDAMMVENMLMFYDEVGERVQALGIVTAAELAEQRRLLAAADPAQLPPAWAMHAAVGIA